MSEEHAAALTLGTAGHIDHGKTALVRALTGVDTDRLPQEQARGMSIELGFAPLLLPGGRRVSVVDVPGHERFVRTMVAGATGIDFHLMVVAADDGVMPQTLEHAEVLAALGIDQGVVAITKCDRASPESAAAEAAELFPDAEIVACSARTGAGVADVAAALERAAARVTSQAERHRDGPAVLHIDRAFTIHGAGTVVTGTLWSGSLAVGATPILLPAQRPVRVRSLQVHDEPAERAHAGQRVAVNLAGIARRDVARGDALADPAAGVVPTQVVDAVLDLRSELRARRVMAHHGTRAVPARLVALGDGLWQLRLEAPLLAAAGDRLVVRSVAPPDTLGGGTVLDPRARRHGRRPDVLARLQRLRRGEPEPEPEPAAPAAARAAPGAPVAARRDRRWNPRRSSSPIGCSRPATSRPRARTWAPPRRTCPSSSRRASPCGSAATSTPTATPSRPSPIASARSSPTRTRSRSRGCATSSARRASTPRRCSSTSTRRATPSACPTTGACCAAGLTRSTDRATVGSMASRTVRARLDAQSEADLTLLLREGGTESDAVRLALAEAANRRRRRSALRAEVARLAADPDDRRAREEALRDLDELEAPWPN